MRPGPIQGDMVHPYLRRRDGLEPVDYPSEELKEVFKRTLGVPLFQEQVMQLAIVAAGYSPGDADQLRRLMAAWKRHGGLEPHRQKLTAGMLERGYTLEYAERIFEPESHAASFALITYVSCWLKCHEPAAFACALINSWHGVLLARPGAAGRAPPQCRHAAGQRALQRLGLRVGGEAEKTRAASKNNSVIPRRQKPDGLAKISTSLNPHLRGDDEQGIRRQPFEPTYRPSPYPAFHSDLYRRSGELRHLPHGRHVRLAGLVTLRQRPQTASGVTFLTLEDEDGVTNIVVWRDLAERQRRVLLESRLLAVEGRLECQNGVQHLIAQRLDNLSGLLGPVDTRSRDFH